MGRRRTDEREGRGRILEAWEIPEGAGDPVGCVATTFTFSPALFEEHCLARFLGLESTPEEDGPTYLIEREEKLSQASCVAIVDQHHCTGSRSLHWDMLPARPTAGILHAKVALLWWSNRIRLIVASANLSDDGYRRNHEVFGVLDYLEGGTAPLGCLREIVNLLQGLVRAGVIGDRQASPAVRRVESLLTGLLRASQRWGTEDDAQRGSEVAVRPVLVGPGRADALRALEGLWPAGSPPSEAVVLSPFFDPPEAENAPARAIWEILRKRGEAKVCYLVEAEAIEGEDRHFVHAPESLRGHEPEGRPSTATEFATIPLDHGRPLHAKGIWLDDGRRSLYMMGSSNFTSAGLGIGRTVNIEANLAYAVDRERYPGAFKAMEKAFLWGGDILDVKKIKWQSCPVAGEDDAGQDPPLLNGFREAVYDVAEGGRAFVTFTFRAPSLPTGWSIGHEAGEPVPVYDETTWKNAGSPEKVEVPWNESKPPSGFLVRWEGAAAPAWWPVNTASPSALPPPEELRDLPLDILIAVLTSARPLHDALRGHLARKKRATDEQHGGINPHARVDTSRFLLRRTRRISELLRALRRRLERPSPTEQSLQWRLRGPVGVMAVATAVAKEATTQGERAFLLAELLMELARVKPQTAPGCLSQKVVSEAVRAVMTDVRGLIPPPDEVPEKNLRTYLADAIARSEA